MVGCFTTNSKASITWNKGTISPLSLSLKATDHISEFHHFTHLTLSIYPNGR